MPNKPRMVWSICQLCKRPYQLRASDLKKGQRFCGKRCGQYSHVYRTLPPQDGENNGNWKGGRTLHSKGYVYITADHPRAHNGYVLEHILVAEQKLGRFLEEGETVHHINGKKWDNRPSNIEVFESPGAHSKHHWNIRRQAND